MYILINMKVDRCPDCNKIISPQETVCSNCGAKLDNRSVKRINSIYHRSNVATFAYLIIFLIAALIYSFFNWVLSVVVGVGLFIIMVYFTFVR